MEELDFFEEICLTSLYATKAVKFAAVVDSNGKMVAGKIRRIHRCEGSTKKTNTTNWIGKGYPFYHNYLNPAINSRTTICWLDWDSNKTYFEITEIANQEEDKSTKLLLAITPLTQKKDWFLCLYLQMPSETSTLHNK